MNLDKTLTETIIHNGIEYNELPAPEVLVKAMKQEFADQLLNSGKLRISHLDRFRNWENKILGDCNDGIGQYYVNGHPMENSSVNDVYAWCLSFPDIADSRLALFGELGGHDCKVVIHDPEEMFQRVNKWLANNHPELWIHCGAVKYDRDQVVDKATLNSKQFHFNVFQKAAFFEEDREYRLSITNISFSRLHGEYIEVEMGNCRDIASIEELPNKSITRTAKNNPLVSIAEREETVQCRLAR